MNIGGLNGGDGRWDMKDSADSFAQYHLANGKSGNSGGRGQCSGRNPLMQLFKAIFFISLLISLFTFTSSDMDTAAAVLLSVAVSFGLALLPLGIVWIWLRLKSEKDKPE
jgi:hypothetical protein